MRSFIEDAGEAFGTSPFMVLSGRKYRGRPDARTFWGASLTHVFKYEVAGDTFRFGDSARINLLPFAVGWNLFRLPDERIVVPNPNGLRTAEFIGTRCYGTTPSLVMFKDGDLADSPIECAGKFEFSTAVLEMACGFSRTVAGTVAVLTGQLPGGQIAVTLVQDGRDRPDGQDATWLAVLGSGLDSLLACAEVGQGSATNQFPVEQAADGAALAWVATEKEIVAMRFDPRDGQLARSWAVAVPFRGRTGTTPTLMDTTDGRRLLVVVDARCAVTQLLSGAIRCSEDATPTRLVVLDRADPAAAPIFVPLPEPIDTVENSPASSGNRIVVANFTGYTPDGVKDGVPDFARGIAMLSWTGSTFELGWLRDDVQISGVPTISTGSQAVYGSGAEEDGMTWFYGLDLASGTTRLRVAVGPSVSGAPDAGDGDRMDAVFDAGNNTVINDDGSALFPGGDTLVRVR